MAITDAVPCTAGDTDPGVQIKVLIADDHPLIIAGIRRTIEPLGDMALVGEARTAAELLELVARRRPDVVLMDLRMPGMNGIEVIARSAVTARGRRSSCSPPVTSRRRSTACSRPGRAPTS